MFINVALSQTKYEVRKGTPVAIIILQSRKDTLHMLRWTFIHYNHLIWGWKKRLTELLAEDLIFSLLFIWHPCLGRVNEQWSEPQLDWLGEGLKARGLPLQSRLKEPYILSKFSPALEWESECAYTVRSFECQLWTWKALFISALDIKINEPIAECFVCWWSTI